MRLRLAVAALLSVVLFGCSVGGTDLQSVADAFDAPPRWQLLGDGVVSEPLCVGADCTTVVIAWRTGTPPSSDDFHRLMRRAECTNIELNDCRIRPEVTGPIPFCRATASSGGAPIEITVAGPVTGETNPYVVTLRVGPGSS